MEGFRAADAGRCSARLSSARAPTPHPTPRGVGDLPSAQGRAVASVGPVCLSDASPAWGGRVCWKQISVTQARGGGASSARGPAMNTDVCGRRCPETRRLCGERTQGGDRWTLAGGHRRCPHRGPDGFRASPASGVCETPAGTQRSGLLSLGTLSALSTQTSGHTFLNVLFAKILIAWQGFARGSGTRDTSGRRPPPGAHPRQAPSRAGRTLLGRS